MTAPAPSPEFSTQHRMSDGLRTVFGIGGLVAILVGALILIFPGKTGELAMGLLAAIVAIYALITGIVFLGSAIFSKTLSGWARTGNILLGLLYVAAGIVIFVDLAFTASVLALFLGVFVGVVWIFEGVFALVALKQSPSKVWSVIYAVISIIAGITLVFTPLLGIATLWWLLGAAMLAMGIVQTVRALTYKSQ